ncbi:MAG: methyltransferase domain-containing protein [bacterium]
MSYLESNIDRVYSDALKYLERHVTNREMQEQISELNVFLHPDRFDMKNYLERSLIRYRALSRLVDISDEGECRKTSWLEVGGLYPVFPLALAMMGLEVSVVENYSFYTDEFLSMYEDVGKNFGVKFKDADFSSPGGACPAELESAFDYVSCMAVVEHIPHTPRFLLGNIRRAMKSGGTFFCEVPNFYYWGNILKMLRGQHMQQPIEAVYHSGVPFVGHHREYTLDDLLYVLRESGFREREIVRFNYSIALPLNLRGYLLYLPLFLFDRFKEILLVKCGLNDSG